MSNQPIRPKIRADWTSPNDEGCKLELSAEIGCRGYQLASIAADPATGEVWFEVYPEGKAVQISVEEISRLLGSIADLQLWQTRVNDLDKNGSIA